MSAVLSFPKTGVKTPSFMVIPVDSIDNRGPDAPQIATLQHRLDDARTAVAVFKRGERRRFPTLHWHPLGDNFVPVPYDVTKSNGPAFLTPAKQRRVSPRLP